MVCQCFRDTWRLVHWPAGYCSSSIHGWNEHACIHVTHGWDTLPLPAAGRGTIAKLRRQAMLLTASCCDSILLWSVKLAVTSSPWATVATVTKCSL